jgi:hypothetical protein
MKIPSVNPLVIKNYYRGIYRRNKANNFFYYQRKKNYRERFIDGAFLSVIPSVINLPTEYVSYADGKIPSIKLLNLVVEYFMLSSTLKSRLIRINLTNLQAHLSMNRQHNNPDHTKCSTHSRIRWLRLSSSCIHEQRFHRIRLYIFLIYLLKSNFSLWIVISIK